MSYEALLTQAVTLHIRSLDDEDDHGNPTYTESNTKVAGFASRQAASEAAEGAIVGESFRLFLQADTPLDGWESVTIEGKKYEVIGTPYEVWNPRTAEVHHVECDIRRASTSKIGAA